MDDGLADAHRALAFAERYGSWDFVDADKEFRRAIELNPNDPVARRWYANAFAVRGRYEQSLEQIDKAQELDPTQPSTLADKGILLYDAGRQQEGIALLKEVARTAPGFSSAHRYLMRIDLEEHNYPAFLAEGKKTAEVSNDAVLGDLVAAAQAGYARGGLPGLLNALYRKEKAYYMQGKCWGRRWPRPAFSWAEGTRRCNCWRRHMRAARRMWCSRCCRILICKRCGMSRVTTRWWRS